MKKNKTENTEFINIDFDKVWKYVHMTRPGKERIKWLLFHFTPNPFTRFAVFHNWKTAQLFGNKRSDLLSKDYWKRQLFHHYFTDTGGGNNLPQQTNEILKTAIVVHVFYLEVFEEIINLLKESDFQNYKLFITCPDYLSNSINTIISSTNFEFQITEVENRGRDVLPFLKILPCVLNDGYELIVKIHTKRSNHLKKNEQWRDDLFMKLLGNGNLSNINLTFQQNPHIGMIGPANHILPMSMYYGGNSQRVLDLSMRMGLKKENLEDLHFVAGTMFAARKEAILPVLDLGLTELDFEPEGQQLDGTMAHSVERIFAAALLKSGLKLADTSSSPDRTICRINLNHKFTI
jgi:lipopolysaccharide biosynthesis protein